MLLKSLPFLSCVFCVCLVKIPEILRDTYPGAPRTCGLTVMCLASVVGGSTKHGSKSNCLTSFKFHSLYESYEVPSFFRHRVCLLTTWYQCLFHIFDFSFGCNHLCSIFVNWDFCEESLCTAFLMSTQYSCVGVSLLKRLIQRCIRRCDYRVGQIKWHHFAFLLVTHECIHKILWFLAHINYIMQKIR